MLNKKILNELNKLVKWYMSCPKDNVLVIRNKFNNRFNKESTRNIFLDFDDFSNSLQPEDKRKQNLYTADIVISLYVRNPNDNLITDMIQRYKLQSQLFGGLISMLKNGKINPFNGIKDNTRHINNVYGYIASCGDFGYWNFPAFFLAIGAVQKTNHDLFEKLVLKDETSIILLNIAKGHMQNDLSDTLIPKLLSNKDQFVRNLSFFILTCKLREHIENQNFPLDIKELRRILNILSNVDTYFKVNILLDYFIGNPRSMPIEFDKILLQDSCYESFMLELKKEEKTLKRINTLANLNGILTIVRTTRRKNIVGSHSKDNIYKILSCIFKNIVVSQNYPIDEICGGIQEIVKPLPKKYINQLILFFEKESQKILFRTEFDKLVRYGIYENESLKWSNMNTILNGLKLLTGK